MPGDSYHQMRNLQLQTDIPMLACGTLLVFTMLENRSVDWIVEREFGRIAEYTYASGIWLHKSVDDSPRVS